ncbi:MAG: VWA domain-containing protein [Firmicutes bacterium]|nr:VWA domain-containing protein [[Eubacterium] siraeum]MCM1488044.1 VWA domain-containing protein [Bacillota bacterium]
MKKQILTALSLISAITLSGCAQSSEMTDANGAAPNDNAGKVSYAMAADYDTEYNTEEYSSITEGGFKSPRTEPLSTFSADVDTASYTNIRRFINNGEAVPEGAVRIEEMLNYFSYGYPEPEEGKAFSTSVEIGDCPWNENTKLLKIGLQTKKIDVSEMPPSNLVFLIDSSGSMYSYDKLPLIKKAFSLYIENMSENDRISIVTYASRNDTLIDGGTIQDKDRILDILSSLEASGSTNGSGGIEAAYKLAEKHFIDGGINRVILATDGDLNVGITSESQLKKLIEEKRESGVYLSVLGVGTGNIKDNKMETLADNGNGNYSYIDSLNEAKRVLIEEKGATFFTVAKDVKFQVEFNPDTVKGYRLIGYENRMLENSDFTDDTKDAGELGAGHSVTVLYEVALAGSAQEVKEYDLEYSSQSGAGSTDICKISTRYKPIGSEESIQEDTAVPQEKLEESLSDDFYFAAAVAEFGMILRNSEYKGTADYDSVLELAEHRDDKEFAELVKKCRRTTTAFWSW